VARRGYTLLHMRRAFTLIEVLIVITVIGILSVVAAVSFQNYHVRSDLNIAAEQIAQTISRARLLSQAGKGGSEWGYDVASGTLYKGTSYATRDPQYDEVYPMSSTLVPSGLPEVSYSKLAGLPSATGTIVLTSLTGEQRIVEIQITSEGIPVNLADKLTICHCQPNDIRTMYIPDSAWPGHQQHGDFLGRCESKPGGCNGN
jgi:prepilin-type N-terminal cleavage/methylation domain-containing protein